MILTYVDPLNIKIDFESDKDFAAKQQVVEQLYAFVMGWA